MIKFWRVCAYEYLHHVLRRRFLFALISLPLIVLVSVGVSLLGVVLQMNPRPVGYVDQAGLIQSPLPKSDDGIFSTSNFQAFPNEADARQALDAGSIQAYYVIAPDYLQTGRIRSVSKDALGENVRSGFSKLVRNNLLAGQPEAVKDRLLAGSSLEVRSLDSQREMSESNWLGIVFPILAGVVFIVVVNTSGGYLMHAVVDEKENRTMEIMVTSITPGKLMAGKIVGNLSVGLTQLLIWMLFPLAVFLVVRSTIEMPAGLTVDPGSIGLMLVTLLPAFVLVAALMATAGATATEAREAQQIAGLFTLPIAAPLWFTSQIISNPSGALAVGMSLFPLTAPVALPLRAAFGDVPAWQTVLSVSLLVILAIAAVWLAGRAFRLGMLRYGKTLTWKELFQK
jgi:ABC-2 type transport system permease protein